METPYAQSESSIETYVTLADYFSKVLAEVEMENATPRRSHNTTAAPDLPWITKLGLRLKRT